MKPYDKLTIVRNRHRARDLRIFRELVESYFDQAAYDSDGLPVDWQAARTARSRINQMLPRVLQIVHAAQLGGSSAAVLQHIFDARYADGSDQEVLDAIDMALGVYEQSRYAALARTVNPLHYLGTAVVYVVRLPVRLFTHLFGGGSSRAGIPAVDVSRIEAAASRIASVEESIEARFNELFDRQAQQFADNAALLAELAERLDFAERVLAQQRPADRLPAPKPQEVVTPV